MNSGTSSRDEPWVACNLKRARGLPFDNHSFELRWCTSFLTKFAAPGLWTSPFAGPPFVILVLTDRVDDLIDLAESLLDFV
jgi:hypothetical protein